MTSSNTMSLLNLRDIKLFNGFASPIKTDVNLKQMICKNTPGISCLAIVSL